MSADIKNRSLLVIISVIIAIVIIFLYLKYKREHRRWVENIKFLNGDTVKVFHHYSHRTIYGPPHFLIGGGGEKYSVWFKYKGNLYRWECLHTSVTIEFLEGKLYVIMFDREKDPDICFRFYKYDKKLIEIPPDDFPKQIAVQNRWVKYVNVTYRVDLPFETYKLNPDDSSFRKSITAKIWDKIAKGAKLRDDPFGEVAKDFLFEYKKQYIEPVWGNL